MKRLLSLVLMGVLFQADAEFDRRIDGPRMMDDWVLSVDDFGAVGDGVSDDTQAFKDAWLAACSLQGTIFLEVPEGNKYMVGPINFGEHCTSNLTFNIQGTIVGPSDPSAWDGFDRQKWIYFHNLDNLRVTGGGTIDGMGDRWWHESCKINKTNPCSHAPTSVIFHRCNNLKVQNLLFVNAQKMHVAFTSCSNVHANNLYVFSPEWSPNTDGIHISSSVSVSVENAIIRTGDDCISIVNGSSKVRVKNIVCGPGHGISIGSLGQSGAYADVNDVIVDGALMRNTDNGVRIKTWQGGDGFVRDVIFKNILMVNVSNPIIIDQFYCDSNTPCRNQTTAVAISRISFVNIKGTSASREAVRFACSETCPCQYILVKNVRLLSENDRWPPLCFCSNAYGVSSGWKNSPTCFGEDGKCIPTSSTFQMFWSLLGFIIHSSILQN
ncbi:Polygalacturonase, family GH28 [Zostera marina]|uniref:endo-polygalacturonase n=1 Tax=Zostera marina TaxID=29655 RepID=A0A0K9NIR3_ZOSMR|nr:Polygalacturonase, family GH28 [Zostera marina]